MKLMLLCMISFFCHFTQLACCTAKDCSECDPCLTYLDPLWENGLQISGGIGLFFSFTEVRWHVFVFPIIGKTAQHLRNTLHTPDMVLFCGPDDLSTLILNFESLFQCCQKVRNCPITETFCFFINFEEEQLES